MSPFLLFARLHKTFWSFQHHHDHETTSSLFSRNTLRQMILDGGLQIEKGFSGGAVASFGCWQVEALVSEQPERKFIAASFDREENWKVKDATTTTTQCGCGKSESSAKDFNGYLIKKFAEQMESPLGGYVKCVLRLFYIYGRSFPGNVSA